MIEFNFLKNPHRIHMDFSTNINYPIDVFFTLSSGKVFWQTSLSHPGWVEGPPGLKESDIRVVDNNGDLIFSHNWTFNSNSDIVEKEFINWCRDFVVQHNRKPNGVVIGSHDGSSGEWVEAYNQKITGNLILIEPNINPFLSLVSRYRDDVNLKFKKCVVSESNEFVDFYTNNDANSESSSLFQNTILKVHSEFQTIKVKSVNPNTLMGGLNIDFLHIDAEGYDAKIILLINDDILSKIKFIIWEHINIDNESEKLKLLEKLKKHNFNIVVGEGYNTCAFK